MREVNDAYGHPKPLSWYRKLLRIVQTGYIRMRRMLLLPTQHLQRVGWPIRIRP